MLIPLLDLTSLNDTDNLDTIKTLCRKAKNTKGTVAAICIFPQFIAAAKEMLASEIALATVANFPHGCDKLSEITRAIERTLRDGADEIDVVINYQDFLSGNKKSISQLVSTCKEICDNKLLKVIIETGALKKNALIDYASRAAINAGADFIKTSTGKIAIGATPEAAKIMLQAIAAENTAVGFKAAGGVRTIEQAFEYVKLAEEILGLPWVSARHFRIGASSLLESILNAHHPMNLR